MKDFNIPRTSSFRLFSISTTQNFSCPSLASVAGLASLLRLGAAEMLVVAKDAGLQRFTAIQQEKAVERSSLVKVLSTLILLLLYRLYLTASFLPTFPLRLAMLAAAQGVAVEGAPQSALLTSNWSFLQKLRDGDSGPHTSGSSIWDCTLAYAGESPWKKSMSMVCKGRSRPWRRASVRMQLTSHAGHRHSVGLYFKASAARAILQARPGGFGLLKHGLLSFVGQNLNLLAGTS